MTDYAEEIVAKLRTMDNREAANWLARTYHFNEIAISMIIAILRAADKERTWELEMLRFLP